MSHDPYAALPPSAAHRPAPPAPWGLLGTIAWSGLGLVAWAAAQFVVLSIYVAARAPSTPIQMEALRSDGFVLALLILAGTPAWIAVCALAARQRGWSARGYLALVAPRRSEIVFGIVCLAALLVTLDALSFASGRDVVPRFMVESYTSARNSGSLVLFCVAIVIVAPVGEEIAFRGFLFRGLSASFLGVMGAIVVTSAAWAVMHIQYDAIAVAQILLIGLLLGWLRWASGSTMLAIGMHMLANLAACLQAAFVVEWLS
jgi:membrane protease YdiL (CAAX protease family)